MSTAIISDELAEQLLQFLESENEFLSQLKLCLSGLSAQPAGQSFSHELIQQLAAVHVATGPRNLHRAAIREQLAAALLRPAAEVRLSDVTAGAALTKQIRERRSEVHGKALSIQAELRTVLYQLTESNVIVTAVLDAVVGAAVDVSRYDAGGQRVTQISPVRGQRVA